MISKFFLATVLSSTLISISHRPMNSSIPAEGFKNFTKPVVLEDFGAYTGQKLMTFYRMYADNDRWKTFDVIENAGGFG